jgi:hypothetical protein
MYIYKFSWQILKTSFSYAIEIFHIFWSRSTSIGNDAIISGKLFECFHGWLQCLWNAQVAKLDMNPMTWTFENL